jgi:transcriptional regulator with PAS, ATPase and Fis domain
MKTQSMTLPDWFFRTFNFAMLMRIAASESTLNIHGEMGTGKEVIAQAIHANSI